MSCCGGRKNRVKPTGAKPKPLPKDSVAEQARSTEMKNKRTQTFNVKTTSGKVKTFGSKLEALAEIARHGGTQRF